MALQQYLTQWQRAMPVSGCFVRIGEGQRAHATMLRVKRGETLLHPAIATISGIPKKSSGNSPPFWRRLRELASCIAGLLASTNVMKLFFPTGLIKRRKGMYSKQPSSIVFPEAEVSFLFDVATLMPSADFPRTFFTAMNGKYV